jgi:hypothetical protein
MAEEQAASALTQWLPVISGLGGTLLGGLIGFGGNLLTQEREAGHRRAEKRYERRLDSYEYMIAVISPIIWKKIGERIDPRIDVELETALGRVQVYGTERVRKAAVSVWWAVKELVDAYNDELPRPSQEKASDHADAAWANLLKAIEDEHEGITA